MDTPAKWPVRQVNSLTPMWHLKRSPHQIGYNGPDSKVHGANMGPIWGRQGLGGPYVSPNNFAGSG